MKIGKIIREVLNRHVLKSKKNILDIETVFRFSEIPTSELYDQYVDYSFEYKSSGYRYYVDLFEDRLSFARAVEAKSEMIRIYGMKDWQIRIVQGYNNVEVILLFAGLFKNSTIIKKEMKRLGFFPSMSSWKRRGLMLWRAIKFEPYCQEDLSSEAKTFQYLYHISPSRNHESILMNGLLPKSDNNIFDYPNRVYVLYGDIDMTNLVYLARQLHSKPQNIKDSKYNVYSIDTNKLPSSVSFYGYPNYPKGYFTSDLIPSDCLSLAHTIHL